MKISKSLGICSLVFFSCFRIYLFNAEEFKSYSTLLILFCGIYLALKKAKPHWSSLLYAIMIIISTVGKEGLNGAFLYAMKIVVVFMLFDYAVKKNIFEQMINNLTILFAGILIINTILIGVYGGALPNSKTEIWYLVGNKFEVSFMNLFLLLLIYHKLKNIVSEKKTHRYKLIFVLCVAYSLYMDIYVDCITGAIATALFIILILIDNEKVHEFFSNPLVPILYVFIGSAVVVGTNFILNSSFLQHIIVGYLNRSETMSGRIYIYAQIPSIIKSHWLTGYGYLSPIVSEVTKIGNAQNGILEIVIEGGIVSGASFLIMMYSTIKIGKEYVRKMWPLYSMIYVFITCSFVEICFDINTIFLLALTASANSYFRKTAHRNERMI